MNPYRNIALELLDKYIEAQISVYYEYGELKRIPMLKQEVLNYLKALNAEDKYAELAEKYSDLEEEW